MRRTSNPLSTTPGASFVVPLLVGAVSGCVIRTQDVDTGNDAGPPCETLVMAPTDVNTALEAARARFEASGTPLDRSVWEDPDKFVGFVKTAYDEIGCSPAVGSEPGVVQQPLHADRGPEFYCGPGHGTSSFRRPPVGECVNHACYVHDSCYTQCSATSHGCEFSAETQPCDTPFFAAVDACMGTESWGIPDAVVRFIAKVIASNASCGADMSCPSPGEAAPGPCGQDRSGATCVACADQVDPANRCRDRACPEKPFDDTCYTANCPVIAPCFGGWGPGTGDAGLGDAGAVEGDGGTPGPVAGDSAWDLVIEGAELPETKPNGLPWDEDFGTGFGPPDPYATVTVAARNPVATPTAQDTVYPNWNTRIAGVTAAELESSIAFDVTDVDLAFDDPVGGCTTALHEEDFAGGHLTVDCGALGGPAGLLIYLHVEPAP